MMFDAAAYPVSQTVPDPVERFMETPGPLGPLRGTMLQAGDGPPPVLIVPGSGPTDRDGNSPLGVSAAPYRLLAEELARAGITSVRIDKRGVAASGGAVADGNAVTVADYAEDVRSWVNAVRSATGAPCVWLLGHSEGGLIALKAAETPGPICGVILVSAPGERFGQTLRDQLQANPANQPLLEDAYAAISELEAGRSVDVARLPPPLQGLFRPEIQGFLISLFAEDPVELAGRYAGPLLIMQGTTDLQVGQDDARRLASANGRSSLVMLDGVNHVLKTAPPDRSANIATYADPSLPLAPEVSSSIVDFITSNPPLRR